MVYFGHPYSVYKNETVKRCHLTILHWIIKVTYFIDGLCMGKLMNNH